MESSRTVSDLLTKFELCLQVLVLYIWLLVLKVGIRQNAVREQQQTCAGRENRMKDSRKHERVNGRTDKPKDGQSRVTLNAPCCLRQGIKIVEI